MGPVARKDWVEEWGGGTIETYDDHRVAMAFSLTGLRTPGIIISNPLCCRKTFENYFDVLDAICRNYLK